MKPLSPSLYGRRNIKKVLASINAVMLSVSFLFILYSFIQCIMTFEKRNVIPTYNSAGIVASFGEKPIEDTLIKEINNNENVDRIVPTVLSHGIKYRIPGIMDSSPALPIREADRDYFMKKQGINLVQGRLPQNDLTEIAVNKDIAKNRNIKIGDKIGDSINKFDTIPREYEVVGILDGESLISIMSINENIFPNYKDEKSILNRSFYVFSKEGKKASMDNYIANLPKDKVAATTKDNAIRSFNKGSSILKVIDIIAILSIVVMVITVGSSKFAQYINRKDEFGVLNAMGFNKNQILFKTFKEVTIVNLWGFILGIALGLIISTVLAKILWAPLGVKGFIFTPKGLIVSMLIPIFTILFSIIPINNLINKLDPIKMIEKN